MFLYNSNFELVAVSDKLLNFLKVSEVDGFVTTYGNICNCIASQEQVLADSLSNDRVFLTNLCQCAKYTKVTIKNLVNEDREVFIFAENILINGNNFIVVNFLFFYELDLINAKNIEKFDRYKLIKDDNFPNIFRNEYLKELEFLKKQEENDEKNFDYSNLSLTKAWFEQTAQNLGFGIDDLYGFLQSFVEEAKGKEEELFESLLSGNRDKYVEILSYIKETAEVLNLKIVKTSIHELEISNKDNIASNFRKYQNMIEQINTIVSRKEKNEV